MNKIPSQNAPYYHSIYYYAIRIFGLIGLCLFFLFLWHLLLNPLWEDTFSWFYILVFIIITYLVGIRAKSTGNPDTIGGFYVLLIWTIAWSCMLIGLVIDFMILAWFGLGLFFLGFFVSIIIYWKLSQIGFYSEVPAIFKAVSRLSHGGKGNFSETPYEAKIEKYRPHELRKYVKLLLKYGIALRVVEDSDSITIYIRKPGNIMKMVLIPGSGFFGQSWIKIQSNGHVVVFVSKNAYESLESPGLYKKLCEAIAVVINKSIKQYLAGEEKGALTSLGFN